MPIAPLSKYGGRDYEGQRDQANNASVMDQLTSNALVGGVLASFKATAAITAGTKFTVSHGLGRTLTAPPITLINPVPGVVYQPAASNPNPKTQIILACTVTIPAGTTLQFYVF